MSKLCIAIMDCDIHYMRAIVDFISINYNYKFSINYFTEYEYLKNYITRDRGTDILLISSKLYNDELKDYNIRSIILLTDDIAFSDESNYMYKYQTGDKLVSELLLKYSEYNPDAKSEGVGSKATRVVGVFSPAGGVGKTSFAVGLSVRAAARKLRVFYLNFEAIASTPLFFSNSSKQGLSEAIYYAKEKNSLISNKIEGLKSVDIANDVHFFNSPGSIHDLEDIKPEDIEFLINQLKQMHTYDVIVIDLGSCITSNVLAVLQLCYKVLLITTTDYTSEHKLNEFMTNLKLINSEYCEGLNEKAINILNKCGLGQQYQSEQKHYIVPMIDQLVSRRHDKYELNLNNDFGNTINNILDEILV